MKKRIPDFCSIFTCELYAIDTIIDEIELNFQYEFILIVTDSKSSLDCFSTNCNKNNIVNKIMSKIQKASNKYSFLWVPSHFQILGNEKADKLAKYAIFEPLPTELNINR